MSDQPSLDLMLSLINDSQSADKSVREGGLKALEGFLTHVHPYLNDDLKYLHITNSRTGFDNPDVNRIIVRSLSHDVQFARTYAANAIKRSKTDSATVDGMKAISSNLGNDFGRTLCLAIQMMNMPLAKAMHEALPHHKPLISTNSFGTKIDSLAIAHSFNDALRLSQDEEKAMHSLILDSGFGEILTNKHILQDSFKKGMKDDRSYSGKIPVVHNGVLHHPELAIAAQSMGDKTQLNRMPFFVHKSDAHLFPDATLFEPLAEFWWDKKTAECPKNTIDPNAFLAEDEYTSNIRASFGYTIPSSRLNEPTVLQDTLRARLVLSQLDQHALGHGQDYLLAVDGHESILSIPADNISVDEVEKATHYTQALFSLQLLLLDNLGDEANEIYGTVNYIGTEMGYGVSDLLRAMKDQKVAETIKKRFPDLTFWRAVCRQSENINTMAALQAFKHFGITADEMGKTTFLRDVEDIRFLSDNDYRITKEGWVNLSDFDILNYNLHQKNDIDKPEIHRYLVKMGGWPFDDKFSPPESLGDLIKRVTRTVSKNPDIIYEKYEFATNPYLMALSVQEGKDLLSAATTDLQYKTIFKLFPDKIQGLEHMMPKTLRRDVIETDLGL